MNITQEKITPEKAREYLGMNTDNYRKLNHLRVITYAADMKSGRWQLNGEGIKFAKNGTLLDGQHRLQAIIKANVPVEMLVIRDVEDDVDIYDLNSPRTIGAILRKNGTLDANYTTIVGIGNFIVGNGDTHRMLGNGALIEYIEKHHDDIAKAHNVTCSTRNPLCRKAPLMAAIYCLYRDGVDLNDMANFCRIVNSGLPQGHYEPSSALVFRNTMNEYNIHTEEQRRALFCVTVQAIRDFLAGRVRTVKYRANPKELDLLWKIRYEDGLCEK